MERTIKAVGIFRAARRPHADRDCASALLERLLGDERHESFFDEHDKRFCAVRDVAFLGKSTSVSIGKIFEKFEKFEQERSRAYFATLAVKQSLLSPNTEAILLYYLRILIEAAVYCHWCIACPADPQWLAELREIAAQEGLISGSSSRIGQTGKTETSPPVEMQECAERIMARAADIAGWVIDLLGKDDDEMKKLKVACRLCSDLAAKKTQRRKWANFIYQQVLLLEGLLARSAKPENTAIQIPIRSSDAEWPYRDGVGNAYHDSCVDAIKTIPLREWFPIRRFLKGVNKACPMDASTVRKWLSLFPENIDSNGEGGNKRQYRRIN